MKKENWHPLDYYYVVYVDDYVRSGFAFVTKLLTDDFDYKTNYNAN